MSTFMSATNWVSVSVAIAIAMSQPLVLESAAAEPTPKSRMRTVDSGQTGKRSPTTPDGAIRLGSFNVEPNPIVMRAYSAFHSGNIAAAETDYAQVLTANPADPDALHGMAAVAQAQGHFGRAEEFYLRAFDADPSDTIAVAGLAGLRGASDPVGAESRLKALIASQANQHWLYFALGNVYAATGRWSEAQQAFFGAYRADPDHPDYVFNLAVSLDHLRQPKPAMYYYERAVAAAAKRPSAFDKTQAATRLRELQACC